MIKYVLGFVAIAIIAMGFFLMNGLGEIKAMSIGDVNLASKSDGTYRGTFSKNRWTYNVSVTVKNHQITEIKLMDDKMKQAEKINTEQISRVINKQSVKVDTVSGATVHSKALLKAIENALNSQPR